ncbi:FecR domain-containing protein [Geothrix paludis]|uniref:FecR domain-containing protein n=1 Tax=Geothrix paludis TaxID=2922722 RepID=UPI001FAE050C|nr:FecR domain-containing protein [Geothrix paludis]
MKLLLAPLTFLLLQVPAPAPAAFTYRFESVQHTVLRWPGGDSHREVKAAAGDPADAGDMVKTGWWGRAVIAVPERASRFEVSGSTQVRLASGEPGVLIVLDQGRLKAVFDALAGPPVERQVAVPGALLAVRGTRYGVEVDKAGKTVLAVFKGVVEVMPRTPQAASVFVKAGEWSTFGPGLLPKVAPMPERGFDERGWDHGMGMDGLMGTGTMPAGGMRPGAMPGPMH